MVKYLTKTVRMYGGPLSGAQHAVAYQPQAQGTLRSYHEVTLRLLCPPLGPEGIGLVVEDPAREISTEVFTYATPRDESGWAVPVDDLPRVRRLTKTEDYVVGRVPEFLTVMILMESIISASRRVPGQFYIPESIRVGVTPAPDSLRGKGLARVEVSMLIIEPLEGN